MRNLRVAVEPAVDVGVVQAGALFEHAAQVGDGELVGPGRRPRFGCRCRC
jgi:hypothetical protein